MPFRWISRHQKTSHNILESTNHNHTIHVSTTNFIRFHFSYFGARLRSTWEPPPRDLLWTELKVQNKKTKSAVF